MKSKKLKEDIIAYGVVLAVALIAILYIIPTQVTVPKAASGIFTPRTYPYICFTVIALCSAIGLCRSVIRFASGRKNDADFMKGFRKWSEKSKREKLGDFMPWICAALCILCAVLFSKIGFIPATLIVAPVILLVLGDRKPMHFVYVYAFCAVMYVIFKFVLGVRLP